MKQVMKSHFLKLPIHLLLLKQNDKNMGKDYETREIPVTPVMPPPPKK